MFGRNVLVGNIISGNIATGNGGGICIRVGSTQLSGNIIAANTTSGNGGGVYLKDYNHVAMSNTVVVDNQASGRGSGIFIDRSSVCSLHSTIARNIGNEGVYITCAMPPCSEVTLTNTILVSHPVGIEITDSNTATVNSILWYNTPIPISQSIMATVYVENQYTGNPLFATDGYHLMAGSAALDKGRDVGIDKDIDGEPRPAGAGYDLGADELWYTLYLPIIVRSH